MTSIMQSPVVCNAGPLIGLARIDLEWLPFQLFSEVIVPEEVCDELLCKDSPDRDKLKNVLEKSHVHSRQQQPDRMLLAELDVGEAAVIMAALKLGLSSVLLDEKKARRIADRVYGLHVKGTAGLLLEAKQRGLIAAVRPSLEGMIKGGYYLGPNLVAVCLAKAGES